MSSAMRILVLGASYGSLFGMKCTAAGHTAHLVCLPAEAEAINRDGAIISIPLKSGDRVEVDSRALPGVLRAGTPDAFDPADHDLVVLAMQEPQYSAPEVRVLLARAAKARVPCLSLMNMPPLTYLRRLPAIDLGTVRDCYTEADIWNDFDPALMTLASPDPQATRLPDAPPNHLYLRLATNFRAARFGAEEPTAVLRDLERDIAAVTTLPVKLRVYESPFVPLGKWCMLLAGNYRCIRPEGMVSIRDAVHENLDAARSVYDWVAELFRRLGAHPSDLVPFDKYAAAALSLQSPASAARALAGGARVIERTDRLIQAIGRQQGMQSPQVDAVVSCVDDWLARNRAG